MKQPESKLPSPPKSNKLTSFPHRTHRKQLPIVGNKSIPVHKLQINRLYQCQMNDHLFERWAFVPTQNHKLSNNQSENNLQRSKKINKSLELRTQMEFQTTSKLFLKRYLKRKDKKIQADTMYYSLSQNQKNTFFEKRRSSTHQKVTKSLTELSPNFMRTENHQNWPQIIVKSLNQDCKMYEKAHKSPSNEETQTNNKYYSLHMSKYLQSSFYRETGEHENLIRQETQKAEAKNRKTLKFKIMQRRRRCFKNIMSTQGNSDT